MFVEDRRSLSYGQVHHWHELWIVPARLDGILVSTTRV
jgi:hypothetical protein